MTAMTRAITVAMITPYPPKLDGIGNHTQALVRALTATGRVELAVLAQRRPAGVAPYVHHVLSGLRSSGTRAALRDIRPDVIHVQFAIPALGPSALVAFRSAARLRAASGTKLVVTCHEVRRELDLLGGLGAVVYRRIVAIADLLIVHTDEARRLLVDACGADPQSVVRLPLGAEPPAPADGSGDAGTLREALGLSGRPFALSFGFVHPDKGVDLAIEALARLRDRDGVDVDLVVAGSVRPRTGLFKWFERADHAHARDLREAVERHDLGDRVRFVGFVPDHVVGELFTTARAVVMPCTAVTQSSVAGLATAHGTPVVASDLPGLREAFGGGAVLVPVGDVDQFADALGAVMRDDTLVSSLAAAQRRRAREVALPEVAEALVERYRSVLAGTARQEVRHG
jgi:glycosyltransferase involved in cell wall biosynthesis